MDRVPGELWAIISTILTLAAGAIAALWTSRQKERTRAQERADAIEAASSSARDALQNKVYALLADATLREKEYGAAMVNRTQTDAQLIAFIEKVLDVLNQVSVSDRQLMEVMKKNTDMLELCAKAFEWERRTR